MVPELDWLLRGELDRASRRCSSGGLEISPRRLSVIIVVLAMIYGICMGTFAVFRPQGCRSRCKCVASMVKVPLLFYLTLLVTLPSLYVFNALVGSRLRLGTVVRLLVASLGVMVTVLASLGPIVAFFSVSTASYPFMLSVQRRGLYGGGHLGLAFLLQTLHRLSVTRFAAAAPADRGRRPASRTSPAEQLDPLENRVFRKHVKTVFRLWVIVFALVGAQMGWVLRPFVGNPNLPFTWFRDARVELLPGCLPNLHQFVLLTQNAGPAP